MDIDFEALAHHGHRVANVVLRIEKKFLWKHVQDNAVLGQRDIAGGVHGAPNVLTVDVTRAMPQGDAAAAVDAPDVAPGDANNGALHGHSGNAFGLFDPAPD